MKGGLDFGTQKHIPSTFAPASPPLSSNNQENDKKYKEVIYNDVSSEEEITLKDIIKKKPKTKIVREFFRANLNSIKSENDLLFE